MPRGRAGTTRDIGAAGASGPAAIGPGKTTLTGALGGPVGPTAGGHGALGPGKATLTGRVPAAATVVASTAESERALDGAFTPALLAALRAHPGASLDQVLHQVSASALAWGPDGNSGLQHPTIVQYGRTAPPGAAGSGGNKHAVLIANEDYDHLGHLPAPRAEADAMQRELASRGYRADIHHDRSAADMAALWGGMVGSAHRGDELVAYYGGHGVPEGLAGIHHGHPPIAPDLFHRAQVTGVVSSATGKGAQIRFVMDSCYSGSVTQAVREERHGELTAAARAAHDEPRRAALAGLHDAKQRLLDLLAGRDAIADQPGDASPEHAARGPRAVRDVGPLAFKTAFETAVERVWAEYVPRLEDVQRMVAYPEPPPAITDPGGLGAQLNYLDDLWNAVAQPLEDTIRNQRGSHGGRTR